MNQNPQAIKFSNEQLRPLADQIAKAYRNAKIVLTRFQIQGMIQNIPQDDEIIDDGSVTDGRNVITNNDCHNLLASAAALVNLVEANNNVHMASVLKVAVNIEII